MVPGISPFLCVAGWQRRQRSEGWNVAPMTDVEVKYSVQPVVLREAILKPVAARLDGWQSLLQRREAHRARLGRGPVG
jgi:hypothetical protein